MAWDNQEGAPPGSTRLPLHQGGYYEANEFNGPVLDLNEQLISNPSSTFFFRMNGDAMCDAGIRNGDLLIVDKSLKAVNGKIIVASVNGELLVRRFEQHIRGFSLVAENPRYGNVEIGEFTDFSPWGLVTCIVRVLEKQHPDSAAFRGRNRRS
ncbi:MAG TPA: S24 family peptidase [Chitinophagaceae bacterium]